MTDPKLVERARELWDEIRHGFNGPDVPCRKLAQALQAHGDEVRRKTVEECLDLVKSKKCDDRNDCYKFMRRKLLEVKGA